MPVFGLPLTLESSLNSLVELRPPTSWRVSGRGNEVVVVMRWSLCGSPSSEKTLDYDNEQPKVSTENEKSPWTCNQGTAQSYSPHEIKTRCSSTRASRASKMSAKSEAGFRPLKIRKTDSLLPSQMSQSPPIPIFITSTASAFSLPATESNMSKSAGLTNVTAADIASSSNTQCKEVACSSYRDSGCEDSNAQDARFSVRCVSPDVDAGSSTTDHEIRVGVQSYLDQRNTENISPNVVTLDEKSGLFNVNSKSGELNVGNKGQTRNMIRSCSSSRSLRDSVSLSEFASTSISFDTQPTSPSISQDDAYSRSRCSSRGETERKSGERNETSRTNTPSSPFRSISQSSRAKRRSPSSSVSSPVFDSDKDNTRSTPDLDKTPARRRSLSRSPSPEVEMAYERESVARPARAKEDVSTSHELDPGCSNATEEHPNEDADSLSSLSGQSSHSFWGTAEHLPGFNDVSTQLHNGKREPVSHGQ